MSERVMGTARNGKTVAVNFGSYTGPAAVRPVDAGIEVAFMGAQPSTSMPIDGRIGVQRARAVQRLESDIPGMHVFICQLVD